MNIKIENLSKNIAGDCVLNNININLCGGNIYGFQGKNGSGKTMLMRAICGLIVPSSGVISINGRNLDKNFSFPPSVGALIENPGFINHYTGFKNLKILSELSGNVKEEQIKKFMKYFNLDPDNDKKFKKYSLGMKQKLGIIAALMENPELIILDEPFNALDEKSSSVLENLILNLKNENRIIIVSCHDSNELTGLCDSIFLMDNGEIVDIFFKED